MNTETATAETRTSTVRIIRKCKCGVKATDYTREDTLGSADKWGSRKWILGDSYRMVDGRRVYASNDWFCPGCKREKKGATVVGCVTDHECGPRCRNSTGPNCDCSCGGKNHGHSYL